MTTDTCPQNIYPEMLCEIINLLIVVQFFPAIIIWGNVEEHGLVKEKTLKQLSFSDCEIEIAGKNGDIRKYMNEIHGLQA